MIVTGKIVVVTGGAAGIGKSPCERFLILPHEIVADYMKRKTIDYDRWIVGMVNLRKKVSAE